MAYNHNENGKPHLAFYDEDNRISFVWNGLPGEPIEVCPGCYGDEVVDYIPTDNIPASAPYPFIAGYFVGQCHRWLNATVFADADWHLLMETGDGPND